MGEPFRSPWLDWEPTGGKGGLEALRSEPTKLTDSESVGFVGGTPGGVGPVSSLRVVVDALEPHPGPVRLNPWTVVLHPERCVRADLASLERVVAALAEARRTSDRRASDFEDHAAELLERLEKCGARVRLVEVLP